MCEIGRHSGALWLIPLIGGCGVMEPWPQTPSPSPLMTPTATEGPDPLAVVAVADTAGLPGGVLLIEERGQPNFVVSHFRFSDQRYVVALEVPQQAFVFDVDASPDGQWAAISYAAPPESGANAYDRGGIYLIDIGEETSAASPLYVPGDAGEYLHLPEVSHDGAYVYFVGEGGRFEGDEPQLGRIDVGTGVIELGPGHVTEPTAAGLSAALAYVKIDPETGARALVAVDGWQGEERVLIESGRFYDLGLPHFSADGLYVYFLVIDDPDLKGKYIDVKKNSVGSQPEHGDHDLPGLWWRVPSAGGAAEVVSLTEASSYDSTYCPGEGYLGFSGALGFYAQDLGAALPSDGALILQSRAIRSVSWLP